MPLCRPPDQACFCFGFFVISDLKHEPIQTSIAKLDIVEDVLWRFVSLIMLLWVSYLLWMS